MARGAWYARILALAGLTAAVLPCALMWGFTVDDALIPLRYAHHLAAGSGYRFDAHGPVTDGVTPLPWAVLLTPLLALTPARGDLVFALAEVKLTGGVVWALAAALLGKSLAVRAGDDRAAQVHAAVALAIVALAFPIGAWAVSGMETGFATALATLAATCFERPRRAATLAGLAAALRPELVVWAVALALGAALTESRAARSAAQAVVVALFPFALCVVIRLIVFGRPAPLALWAKPSDVSHGLAYAAAASVVVLTPLVVLAPVGLRRGSSVAKALTLAAALHVLVVIAVGGDWMPYARLLVPVAPGLAIVHLELVRRRRAGDHGAIVAASARALGAAALGVALAITAAPAGRHVFADRERLIEAARPVLASTHVVAALDVGWVGAATDADIVDLAGLTDPTIASLSGGHTSKRVDVGMLLDRNVDTVVVYSRTRAVEARLVGAELFASHYAPVAELPLGAEAGYTIYRAR